MFTKDELDLIDAALTEYFIKHTEEYTRQRDKGRKNCGWHLRVLDKITALQSKIYMIKNGM